MDVAREWPTLISQLYLKQQTQHTGKTWGRASCALAGNQVMNICFRWYTFQSSRCVTPIDTTLVLWLNIFLSFPFTYFKVSFSGNSFFVLLDCDSSCFSISLPTPLQVSLKLAWQKWVYLQAETYTEQFFNSFPHTTQTIPTYNFFQS